MVEKVVKIKEVEKLKSYIESILENSITLSDIIQRSVLTEGIDMNEKEKSIFEYIINNQGVIKEHVVNAFKEKAGYSRKPVFKILRRLEEYEYIKIIPNPTNNRKHQLYLNNQNEIGSLAKNVDSFSREYCRLITCIKKNCEDPQIALDFHAIIMPLKFFIRLFSNSILWNTVHPDKEILHRKFAFISNAMETIYLKLSNTMQNNSWIKSAEEITTEIMYDGSNIFHPEKIINMLRIFEKYGLRENAEMVLDCLWNIGYPIIRFMYPYYSLKNPDVPTDWRKLITEYETFPIPAERSYHRITKTD